MCGALLLAARRQWGMDSCRNFEYGLNVEVTKVAVVGDGNVTSGTFADFSIPA